MRLSSTLRQGMLGLMVAGLPLTICGQNAPRIIPTPRDAGELVTGEAQIARTAASREGVLRLLNRARNNYQLKSSGQAWDLKVRFTVDSQGATNYDGAWAMEDVFAPEQGDHWTATSDSGYTITGIFGKNAIFTEGTASAIPLRLQEARAMLFNPLPSAPHARGGSIRTFQAAARGSQLTCILLTQAHDLSNPTVGRGWDETEECIDSQSGLLKMHSEAPGRYAVYDYSGATPFDGHTLPRTVTITEGGRVVSTISVESLEAVGQPDPDLFVPTDAMKAAGVATTMASAIRISRTQGQGPFTSAMTAKPVCVFGLVTPYGQLVEAHSLQPSDPNSEAAIKDAQLIDFVPFLPASGPPQQRFVFVVEKFISAQ
jgi:hypothetical protein